MQSEQIASFPGNLGAASRKNGQHYLGAEDRGQLNQHRVSGETRCSLNLCSTRRMCDVAKGSTSIDGVVIIFDSEDGGMTAATVAVLRQWKTGALSEEAFWRRCFFDPPEAFNSTSHPVIIPSHQSSTIAKLGLEGSQEPQ